MDQPNGLDKVKSSSLNWLHSGLILSISINCMEDSKPSQFILTHCSKDGSGASTQIFQPGNPGRTRSALHSVNLNWVVESRITNVQVNIKATTITTLNQSPSDLTPYQTEHCKILKSTREIMRHRVQLDLYIIPGFQILNIPIALTFQSVNITLKVMCLLAQIGYSARLFDQMD